MAVELSLGRGSVFLVLASCLAACGASSPPPGGAGSPVAAPPAAGAPTPPSAAAATDSPAPPQSGSTAADVAAPPTPPAPPPPTVVELTFSAAGDVNPDPSGRASPISVRYYQLTATDTFENGDYFQIHDKEAAVLGGEVLDRHDLAVMPGASQTISIDAMPAAKAVGVVASYRDIDDAQWRADVPIPANQTTRLKVQLDKLKLAIVPQE